MSRKPVIRQPTCQEIEVICANIWGYRQNLVIPNISWGLGLHECDLLVLSKAGYATEVEIKVSLSDLKKDAGKPHGHQSDLIRYLYFAVPEKLVEAANFIPERAGIIAVTLKNAENPEWGFRGAVVREPECNSKSRKWTEGERANLARLGCMRIWGLKAKLNENRNNRLAEKADNKLTTNV